MAWDTERTRQLLLDAATVEFSARGLAGARVDRIATEAGVNKERIYSYFGSKDGLFAAVLEARLAEVMDAVPIRGEGIDAITDYAGRLFDYHVAHPELARLTFWEGLERGVPIAEDVRAAASTRKVEHLCSVVPGLGEQDARELLLSIITLCDGYPALPNVDRLYLGAGTGAARVARRRETIVRAVEAMAKRVLAPSAG